MNPTANDTSFELRDIKPAVEIPDPSGWPAWVSGALIALALMAVAIAWWQWRRRRSSASPSATDIALEELEATRRLVASADASSYAMAVSDVLRRHIQRQFDIAAIRQTSEEFLQGLSSPRPGAARCIDKRQRIILGEFLEQCDLVKFARGELGLSQRENLHDAALSFIQSKIGPDQEADTAVTREILTPSPQH